MRIVLLILDGLADKIAEKPTSLEKARTKNLDWFAARSECGLLWPIKGIAPESGEAQFVLLGYPLHLYPGRGIIEALGAGIKIKKDCVYFRVNFARFRGNKITDTRAIVPKQAIEKINSFDKRIKIYPTVGYRAVLEVKGISPNISNTHLGYIKYKNYSRAVSRKMIKRKARGKGSNLINNFVGRIEKEFGFTLLLRGASNKLPRVKKMHDWAFIGDMPVEYGLARLAGMKILKRKNEIEQILNEKRNVYVQIKGPDKYGHKGDIEGKVKAIEKIDKLLGKLKNINAILCITSDHATPYTLKRHSSDPVPILIYDPRKPITSKCQKFSEREFSKGFKIEGYQLMKLLIKKAK